VLITKAEIATFTTARNATPHSLLGMHTARKGTSNGLVVRAFLRETEACEVVDLTKKTPAAFPMTRLDDAGLFDVVIPRRKTHFRYQLRATRANGEIHQFYDPYCFLPTLGEQDLYLFNEGNEHRIYEKLGAHLREIDGVRGVTFAVWAPSAARVSVVGNFNPWDGRFRPMRPLGASGVWELFVPGLGSGELYKYEIFDQQGHIRIKTDPYGTYFEAPPGNAAIVCNTRVHQWNDADWMKRRAEQAATIDRPVSVYEVHLGSWKRKLDDAARP